MLIDMVEEVYKDIFADDQGGATADPFAEEMRKALEDSHKKMDELTDKIDKLEDSHKKMDELTDKIDKLASTGFSIDNENTEPESGTEKANESEETENEDQNT